MKQSSIIIGVYHFQLWFFDGVLPPWSSLSSQTIQDFSVSYLTRPLAVITDILSLKTARDHSKDPRRKQIHLSIREVKETSLQKWITDDGQIRAIGVDCRALI